MEYAQHSRTESPWHTCSSWLTSYNVEEAETSLSTLHLQVYTKFPQRPPHPQQMCRGRFVRNSAVNISISSPWCSFCFDLLADFLLELILLCDSLPLVSWEGTMSLNITHLLETWVFLPAADCAEMEQDQFCSPSRQKCCEASFGRVRPSGGPACYRRHRDVSTWNTGAQLRSFFKLFSKRDTWWFFRAVDFSAHLFFISCAVM